MMVFIDRFGSFEILTSNGEFRLLRQLADFVIEQYFPQVKWLKRVYLLVE